MEILFPRRGRRQVYLFLYGRLQNDGACRVRLEAAARQDD